MGCVCSKQSDGTDDTRDDKRQSLLLRFRPLQSVSRISPLIPLPPPLSPATSRRRMPSHTYAESPQRRWQRKQMGHLFGSPESKASKSQRSPTPAIRNVTRAAPTETRMLHLDTEKQLPECPPSTAYPPGTALPYVPPPTLATPQTASKLTAEVTPCTSSFMYSSELSPQSPAPTTTTPTIAVPYAIRHRRRNSYRSFSGKLKSSPVQCPRNAGPLAMPTIKKVGDDDVAAGVKFRKLGEEKVGIENASTDVDAEASHTWAEPDMTKSLATAFKHKKQEVQQRSLV